MGAANNPGGSMILVRKGGQWGPARLTSYDSEAELQQLLADDPSLIPGCTGAAAATEVPVPGVGSVDIVCVDGDGVITLVECKLRANPQIRREVVGQIVAYASGLEGVGVDHLDEAFRARTGESLESAVSQAGSPPRTGFRDAVADHLANGEFRLVVAVDEITDELRRSVEYLNNHSNESTLFLALELGYARIDDSEILVPQSYGAEFEDARRAPKSSTTRRWSESDIDRALTTVPPAERGFIAALRSHAAEHAALVKGGTGEAPSAGFHYLVGGKRKSLWTLYVRPQGAAVSVNLGAAYGVSPRIAAAMAAAMTRSPTLSRHVHNDQTELAGKYPEFDVTELAADPHAQKALLDALDAAVNAAPPLGVAPFTEEETGPAWQHRVDDLISIVDWVTRQASGSRVLPMQSGTGYLKHRYVSSVVPDASYAVGVRKGSTTTPLWMRYHCDTPHHAHIAERLRATTEPHALDTEGGHTWVALQLPAGVDGDTLGEGLLEQIRSIESLLAADESAT